MSWYTSRVQVNLIAGPLDPELSRWLSGHHSPERHLLCLGLVTSIRTLRNQQGDTLSNDKGRLSNLFFYPFLLLVRAGATYEGDEEAA